MEAGCKKKEWDIKEGVAFRYHWVAAGTMLATGVCIDDDYKQHFPPDVGTTKVYSMINTPQVRQVDAKRMTISMDFTLTMQWLDSRIKTNLDGGKLTGRSLTLGPKAIDKIWSPDLHILNRQSFKLKDEWASMIATRILIGTDLSLIHI